MPVYAFGPFILDPAEHWLTRSGRRVAVPAKAWQILLLLAEAGGRLVPHETFRAKLWPNVVVEDRTLTVHMSTLRKALGSGPPEDCIQTVAKAGYRLTVPVRVLSEADRPPPTVSGPPMIEAKPLAVGTFSTGDLAEADTYLGVGIADAVTTALGGLPGLTVWPVGAVDDLAGARDAGAGHMLEGAVRRQAKELRRAGTGARCSRALRERAHHLPRPPRAAVSELSCPAWRAAFPAVRADAQARRTLQCSRALAGRRKRRSGTTGFVGVDAEADQERTVVGPSARLGAAGGHEVGIREPQPSQPDAPLLAQAERAAKPAGASRERRGSRITADRSDMVAIRYRISVLWSFGRAAAGSYWG
jgi:DNA-binding winged helix-turn-helix (wHTH) protein